MGMIRYLETPRSLIVVSLFIRALKGLELAEICAALQIAEGNLVVAFSLSIF